MENVGNEGRESALSVFPLLLVRVKDGLIRSLQPNYSFLRVYPHVEFLFDVSGVWCVEAEIGRTSVPVIRCNGKVVFGSVEWFVCLRWDPPV